MASEVSFTNVSSVTIYGTQLANVFQAYRNGVFTARRSGHYYIELCAGVQVTSYLLDGDCLSLIPASSNAEFTLSVPLYVLSFLHLFSVKH